jgi:hypothetical protein
VIKAKLWKPPIGGMTQDEAGDWVHILDYLYLKEELNILLDHHRRIVMAYIKILDRENSNEHSG